MRGDPERPGAAARGAVPERRAVLSRAPSRTRSWRIRGDADAPTAPYAEFDALPPFAVVRGADDPLVKLKEHIRSTPHRVLVIAESDGRRESLLDFLRASGVSPPAFDSLAEFEAYADEKIGIATAALVAGFAWREARHRLRHRDRALRHRADHAPPQQASRSRSATSRR